jgi:3-phenylpropionate/trans-cinnamate dioxygenase ferredoxin subunit
MAEKELVIIPHNNGPYEVRGKVKIITEGGRLLQTEGTEAWLCRCGQSASKPFCDGTHTKVGSPASPWSWAASTVACPSAELATLLSCDFGRYARFR